MSYLSFFLCNIFYLLLRFLSLYCSGFYRETGPIGYGSISRKIFKELTPMIIEAGISKTVRVGQQAVEPENC